MPASEKKNSLHNPSYRREEEKIKKACDVMINAFYIAAPPLKAEIISIRLARLMNKIIRSDNVNTPGKRNINEGNIWLLEGFQFNQDYPMPPVDREYEAAIDRMDSVAICCQNNFVAASAMTLLPDTTHVQFFLLVAAINFDKNAYSFSFGCSGDLQVDKEYHLELSNKIPNRSNSAIIMGLGLFQLRPVNKYGKNMYQLCEPSCQIIKASDSRIYINRDYT
ncbi:MAG: hypothetical protein QM731_07155 [Chitinophagaceae bacterium]